MRRCVLSVVLLITSLCAASPAAAEDVPTLAVVAIERPNYVLFAVLGSGFIPFRGVYLRVESIDGSRQLALNHDWLSANDWGYFGDGFMAPGRHPAGEYLLTIVDRPIRGDVVASTRIRLVGATSPSAMPSAGIFPNEGKASLTQFVFVATELDANTAYPWRIQPKNYAGPPVNLIRFTSDSDGVVVAPFAVIGPTGGVFTVDVFHADQVRILVSAEFRVVGYGVPSPPPVGNGGYLPGLPSTGGGGMQAPGHSPISWYVAVPGALAGRMGAMSYRRRRRMSTCVA